MKTNITSDMENTHVLEGAELDVVAGGIAASQAWVSLSAIHGFNPQPDPPAIWASRMLLGTADHA